MSGWVREKRRKDSERKYAWVVRWGIVGREGVLVLVMQRRGRGDGVDS